MPSSLTQTVTVVALSDSEVIKRAWETNPDFDIIFYAIWCIMYALTISPSVVGVTPILSFKQVIFWYLVYEAVLNYLNLDKHPEDEAKIVNGPVEEPEAAVEESSVVQDMVDAVVSVSDQAAATANELVAPILGT
jgi:hypothetical protein